jgi:nucleoside-diphosphate-sugar epimerase
VTPARSILVTGADGRLGAALTSRLAADGTPLVRAGRDSDVTDTGAIARLLSDHRPDAIVHLASITGSACDTDPSRTRAVNVDATAAIARAAAAAGVRRFVFTSSAAVYGDARDTALRESDPVQPASAYAESKVAAEQALEQVASDTGVEVITLRLFNLYGPRFDASLITRLLTSTETSPAPLFGWDGFVRDYVHVGDVVGAILLAVRLGPPPRHVYNIASGEALSNRAVVERLAHRGVFSRLDGDMHSYSYADVDAARTELGFRPRRLVGDDREEAER